MYVMDMLKLALLVMTVCVCIVTAHGLKSAGKRVRVATRGAGCTWIPSNRKGECPRSPSMANDVLQRRQSNLLADVDHQGTCGSCWAFSATHTFTDRLSITMGQKVSLLSSQQLTECIDTSANGCCGATAPSAYEYIRRKGTVDSACKPYLAYDYSRDANGNKPPLTCAGQCTDTSLRYSPSSYNIRGFKEVKTVNEMMNELQYGPISAAFRVSDEFYDYACGIFCDNGYRLEGGHAVEIVDYGTENGVEYWVVKNSWGGGWGEQGYFRIRRGRDDFNIETRRVHAPILTGNIQESPTTTFNQLDIECAPEPINTNDTDVADAAQFVIKMLQGKLACFSGSPSRNGSISIEKVDTATCQVVAGELFTLLIDAQLEGCSDQAYITATVLVRLDGEYELINYEYSPTKPTNSATTINSASLAFMLYFLVLFTAVL